MDTNSRTPQASLNEDYWLSYVRFPGAWRALEPEDRKWILDQPILGHPSRSRSREPEADGIEVRTEIIKAFHRAEIDARPTVMMLLARLMQICWRTHQAMAPGRTLDDLADHLLKHVLCDSMAVEFSPDGRRSFSWESSGIKTIEHVRFASRQRLRSFLALKKGEPGLRWEIDQRQAASSYSTSSFWTGSVVTELARRMLARLVEAGRPLLLGDLVASLKIDSKQPAILAKAIRGLVQYVFVVIDLDPAQDDLRISLWPALRDRLEKATVTETLPQAVASPPESSGTGFFFSDLAVVVAAAANPLPLKQQTTIELHSALTKELAARLAHVPDWVGGGSFTGSQRIQVAVGAAWGFGYLSPQSGGKRALASTKAGRDWLALPAGERMQAVLDTVRRRRWRTGQWTNTHWNFLPTYEQIRRTPSDNDIMVFEDEIAEAWKHLPLDVWHETNAWLDHAARVHNPITARVGAEGMVMVSKPDDWRGLRWVKRAAENLEAEARKMLASFLLLRLIPFGGVEVGRVASEATAIRLTEVGRYFLGARLDFPPIEDSGAGRVLLQPNFEIVFLGPNLAAEAVLGAFCERIGQNTGTIFRLTKARVQQALHSGTSVERILRTLRETTGREPPANVATELGAWATTKRTYRSDVALVLRCPDAATARRVHGVLGEASVLHGETLVELTAPLTAGRRRKLEQAGVFEDAPPEPPPAVSAPPGPHRPRPRRRGRW